MDPHPRVLFLSGGADVFASFRLPFGRNIRKNVLYTEKTVFTCPKKTVTMARCSG